MVQEGYYILTLGKRGPLENGRDPYNVYAGSHQILAICCSLALGCTCRCLAWNRALHVGVRVVHAGVGLEVGAGHRRWRWAQNVGVGL